MDPAPRGPKTCGSGAGPPNTASYVHDHDHCEQALMNELARMDSNSSEINLLINEFEKTIAQVIQV
jgi:hypothetical protein